MRFSLVIPAYNEEESIVPLYRAIVRAMHRMMGEWELIFIDDGSTDSTFEEMRKLHERDARVKVIRFRRNFGQTAAWAAGFKHACGELVVALDADLQNDPADIPAMVEKLEREGYDVISGWRRDRKDPLLKSLVSRFGNWLRRRVTGERIHDQGCSLKVYRRECLKNLELYGEMHRYITALLTWKGFRVGEMVVRHHPRRYGKTKYTMRKTIKGLLDLLVVKFWMQYSARPIHFFGTIGIILAGLGFLLGGTLGILWLLRIIALQNRTSPLLAALLVIIGLQFITTGVLADIVAKNYYEHKPAYNIALRLGFENEARARRKGRK
jgi:glycosyltransferase involved in cell wall biosynthesis